MVVSSREHDDELQVMLDLLADDALMPEQVGRLESILMREPGAIDQYLDHAWVVAGLIGLAGESLTEPSEQPMLDPGASAMDASQVLEALDAASRDAPLQLVDYVEEQRAYAMTPSPVQQDVAGPAPVRHIVIPRPLVYGGLAALLAMVVWAGWQAMRDERSPAPVVSVQSPPAVLLETLHARWGESPIEPRTGMAMPAGAYTLLEGSVQLELAEGAAMIVTAPASFDLESANRARLHFGRVSAQVPARARGFSIDVPSIRIMDLGTSFGVQVDENRVTEVHLFEGVVELGREVETDREQMVWERLDGSEARRFDPATGRLQSVPVRSDLFWRSWDEVLVKPVVSGVVRWLETPPPSLVEDAFEDDETMWLLPERTGVPLERGFRMNIADAGTHIVQVPTWQELPAATRVDSYCLHIDRVGVLDPNGDAAIFEGRITFPRPIVGIIADAGRLVATDGLFARLDTAFGQSPRRGLFNEAPEGSMADQLEISADRRTLRLTMHVGNFDQMRILIESAPDSGM